MYRLCSLELASTSANASKTDSSADVIGRTFNTPLRASAVANLAQKDKSAQKSTAFNLAQKLAVESVETSSRASSVPGDAQDVARAYVTRYFYILNMLSKTHLSAYKLMPVIFKYRFTDCFVFHLYSYCSIEKFRLSFNLS